MTPPLSHGELRQMEEAAKNKPGVRGGKVPFPIVVDTDTIFEEVHNDLDEKIMQAVINVGITVNKPELIRALELDKKVREGKLIEINHGEWIAVDKPTDTATICECSLCGLTIWKYDKDPAPHTWNFCPRCGARMDGGDTNANP